MWQICFELIFQVSAVLCLDGDKCICRSLVRIELELPGHNEMAAWDILKCFDSCLMLLCKNSDLSLNAN